MTSDPNLKQNCLPRREPHRQRHGAPPALARSSLATRKASATSSRPASSRTHAASERVCSALALARYRRCAGSSHFCAPFTIPPVPSKAPVGARRRRKTTRTLEAYCDNVDADRHTVTNTSSAGTLGGQGSTAAALHTRKGTARPDVAAHVRAAGNTAPNTPPTRHTALPTCAIGPVRPTQPSSGSYRADMR